MKQNTWHHIKSESEKLNINFGESQMKNGFIQKMKFLRIVEHQKRKPNVIVDACHNKKN